MTTTVEAIYDHGKLLLPAPLSLPEKSRVRVTIESGVERESWLKLSEENLLKTWNNDADDDDFNELKAMANDPQIQRELRSINTEFTATESDGLGKI